jgi:cellulose synthase/poly-beta-1,6-N-acetylglucosamine synthase-like glycosyltransferase
MPAYLEEEVIGDTLNHLLNDIIYPNLEIIIAVDTKEDNTYKIVSKFAHKHKNVKIDFSKKRRGMVSAISSALKKSTGDIIIKSDSEVRYVNPSECMFNLIKYYKNPKIGGVCLKWKPYGADIAKEWRAKGFAAKGEIFINELVSDWREENYSKIDKKWDLPLVCNSFRSSLIKDIDENVICDDAYYGYIVIDKGYKIVLADDIIHYFVGVPSDARRLFLQKRRGALGWFRMSESRKVDLRKFYVFLFGFFLKNIYKYSLEELIAFFYWCMIFSISYVGAKRKLNADQKDVWIKYKREVRK